MRVKSLAVVFIVVLTTASCARSPQQYFESGNAYAQKKQYGEAIVQYKSAIQKDPRYGEARLKLAEAYLAVNDPANAYREYLRASDLLPSNVEAHVKAATFLLAASQFEDARARAARALKVDPKNVDAQVILANATAGLKDFDGAIQAIQQAIALDPSAARSYANLGALEYAKGNRDQAERAYNQAVATEPNSVPVRLALANFYWIAKRVPEAEQTLKDALALEPTNLLTNRALAFFYLASNRPAEAEQYLKTAAETAKAPEANIALAAYYAQMNRPADAIRTLEVVAGQKPWYGRARSKIATIEYAQGQHDLAHKTIDGVLAQEPNNAEALLAKASFLANERKFDEALGLARASVAADPRSAAAQYLLGSISVSLGDNPGATKAFTEVTRLDPRNTAAHLQLSQLQLAAGDTAPAVQHAEQAVNSAPASGVAHLALARGLLARGDVARAETEMRTLVAANPQVAAVNAGMGTVLLAKRDAAGARRSYERALQLDANSYEALAGLLQLDAEAGRLADARGRLDTRLAASPDDASLLVLGARTCYLMGESAKTEQHLLHAIQVSPGMLAAYSMLGELYASQGRLEEAKDKFAELARRNQRQVWALTAIGMILQLQDRHDDAQKQYEKVLAIDARAPVAANNLAWLYAERGGNLDVALQLARTAKEQLPDSSEVNDTLGWVYYKKGLASLAIPPLEAAAQTTPADPTIHYHLGLAYAKAGHTEKAKQSLERALRIRADFEGAVEARKLLQSIG